MQCCSCTRWQVLASQTKALAPTPCLPAVSSITSSNNRPEDTYIETPQTNINRCTTHTLQQLQHSSEGAARPNSACTLQPTTHHSHKQHSTVTAQHSITQHNTALHRTWHDPRESTVRHSTTALQSESSVCSQRQQQPKSPQRCAMQQTLNKNEPAEW